MHIEPAPQVSAAQLTNMAAPLLSFAWSVEASDAPHPGSACRSTRPAMARIQTRSPGSKHSKNMSEPARGRAANLIALCTRSINAKTRPGAIDISVPRVCRLRPRSTRDILVTLSSRRGQVLARKIQSLVIDEKASLFVACLVSEAVAN